MILSIKNLYINLLLHTMKQEQFIPMPIEPRTQREEAYMCLVKAYRELRIEFPDLENTALLYRELLKYTKYLGYHSLYKAVTPRYCKSVSARMLNQISIAMNACLDRNRFTKKNLEEKKEHLASVVNDYNTNVCPKDTPQYKAPRINLDRILFVILGSLVGLLIIYLILSLLS